MRDATATKLLRVAAVLALVGLALMTWGIVDQSVIPVVVSMTVGQGIGTLSFMVYLFVIVRDMMRTGVLSHRPHDERVEGPSRDESGAEGEATP